MNRRTELFITVADRDGADPHPVSAPPAVLRQRTHAGRRPEAPGKAPLNTGSKRIFFPDSKIARADIRREDMHLIQRLCAGRVLHGLQRPSPAARRVCYGGASLLKLKFVAWVLFDMEAETLDGDEDFIGVPQSNFDLAEAGA